MSAFRVSETELCVYLHPSASRNVPKALRRQLSSLVLKFNDEFDGVVLAHYDMKILDRNTGKVLNYLSPYFGVRLRTKLLLFSPKTGMFLEGKVTTIGLDFVRAIVFGISVATISFDDIREEFNYEEQGDDRILCSTRHQRHIIKVHSILRFLVKSVEETTGDIRGSLMPRKTGCALWLHSHKARKLEKHTNVKVEEQDHDTHMEDYNGPSKKHESKRRKVDRNIQSPEHGTTRVLLSFICWQSILQIVAVFSRML